MVVRVGWFPPSWILSWSSLMTTMSLFLVLLCSHSLDRGVAAEAPSRRDSQTRTETNAANSSSSFPKCSTAGEHPDFVRSLPGYGGPLPSDWYSGYLDYEFQGQTIHTHYVFVQAESDSEKIEEKERNTSKPLLYWSNGGPGASSMFGLLTELGPLWLSDASLETVQYQQTGIPSPAYNPWTWTKLGHVLLIDQPAPIGFSYCNDDTDSRTTCSEISWTDELASENAYLALRTFYETKLPCFDFLENNNSNSNNKNNFGVDLYLTGESYGGIYIPTLARRILQDNDENIGSSTTQAVLRESLKGFAVGDGCLGTQTEVCGELSSLPGFRDFWKIFFMAGHHQIPLKDFHILLKLCHHADQPGFLLENSADDQKCQHALSQIKQELGGYFEYALYDDCTYRNGLLQQKLSSSSAPMQPNPDSAMHAAMNDYPCGGGLVMEEYLKLEVVKSALHVVSDFFETDNAVGFDYTTTEPDLRPFYQELVLSSDDKQSLKILIYNGDTDPAINSFAAQNWTSHLGFQEIEHWRPWTVDGCQRTGGYVTRYEGNFDFLTIRGAGHMVPTYKPEATYAFLKAWLDGSAYPSYDPNCVVPPSMFGKLQVDFGNDGMMTVKADTVSLNDPTPHEAEQNDQKIGSSTNTMLRG